jgi:hypothetical protein
MGRWQDIERQRTGLLYFKLNKMKPKIIFIEYLNRDNNFTVDKIYFDNYEDAKAWAKNNLDNFN